MADNFQPAVLEALNPGLMTGTGNRTYLVGRGDLAVLIDAGTGKPGHLEAVDRALIDRRARLGAVAATHGHDDHVRGAPHLAARYPDARFWKFPWPGEDARAGVAWRALGDGDELQTGDGPLRVVHTPGHSPDHCAFWHEPSASIFAGDLVIPGGSVVIHTARGGSMREYLASLERLLALAPRRLWPAHGEAVDDPVRVLSAAIAHRLEREAQVLAALEAGHDTAPAIAESIYHGLPRALLMAAQLNVLAHLEKLRDDRRAAPGADDRWRRV